MIDDDLDYFAFFFFFFLVVLFIYFYLFLCEDKETLSFDGIFIIELNLALIK